jgi:hypothetical protein
VKGVLDVLSIITAKLEVVNFETRKITLETSVGSPLHLKGPTNVMEAWIKAIDQVGKQPKVS